MQILTNSGSTLSGLVRQLTDETKTFIKQEVELAKTEISEKAAWLGRNAVSLAIGGTVAYAGALVLLVSLGFLLAYAFEAAGLSRSLANFLGFLIIGLLAAGIGLAFVMKALKNLAKEPIKPEKTLRTLREVKPGESAAAAQPVQPAATPEPKPSSAQLEANISATREEIKGTTEEIREHLTARHFRQVLKANIQEHPVRAGLIGAGTGLATGLLIKSRRANHHHHHD